jgi:tetratricopeptide (TPR) repeat protein
VTGQRVVVRDRLASWEPESRQGALDFDLRMRSEPTVPRTLQRSRTGRGAEAQSAAGLMQMALDLELAGRTDEARSAYHAVLEQDPQLVSARINLARLLHTANRLAEAEALYRAALEQDPGNALAAFNLAVALEDQGETDAAIDSYRATLDIDPAYADAHFNLSRLLEAKGDQRGVLRHLSTFRRLIRKGS